MNCLKVVKLSLVLGAALAIAACGDGPVQVASPGEAVFSGGGGGGGPAASCPTGFANVGLVANNTLRNCQLPNSITGSLTVPNAAGTVYSISGRVDVGVDRGGNAGSPVGTQGILTVEAGVRIFGSAGLDYIVVNRGSQIFAVGTVTQPIIFTSRQSIEGTTGVDSIGQWGGLVILGRAFITNCPGATTADQQAIYGTAACENQVEGTNALYGGNSNSDNSGTLRYVRVQHSGFEILPNNELNGITLAGVGSGTIIDHIQVHNSSDDGIELFGGNVNLKQIVLTGIDDDGLDTDQGYRGAIQFVLMVQRPNGGNRPIEASLAANAAVTNPPQPARRSNPLLANFTIIGSTNSPAADGLTFNTGTFFRLYNGVVVFTKAGVACLDIDNASTVGTAVTFRSVFLSCAVTFNTDNDGGTPNEEADFFNAGTNNTSAGTSTLSNIFVNGANETAVPAVDFAALASTEASASEKAFLTQVPYIGAVKDSTDTWWQGWTCGIGGGTAC